MELSGAVGILTGASRGLGVRFAEALAVRGVHLALAARSIEQVEETAERLRSYGVRTIAVRCDVTSKDDLKTLVGRTEAELGPPGLLFNNAGIDSVVRFHEQDPDEIERMIDTNLRATMLLTRYVLPGMVERRRGHIVNVSSTAALTTVPYMSPYAATKFGVAGFSYSLRAEVAGYDVGVTAVLPHYVSEIGMYANWEESEPGTLKRVSPDDVVAKTLAAIEANKARVVISPPLMRNADLLLGLTVDGTIAMAHRTGAFAHHQREADRRA